MTNDDGLSVDDLRLLRRTFELAHDARRAGYRPFGAVIADAAGIIVEGNSTQTRGDPTAHAEMNAVRAAMAEAPRARLRQATIYASSEPCAMCAAAIFYAGLSRIVFGFGEEKLGPMRNATPQGAGLRLASRDIYRRLARPPTVSGPHLEAEAEAVHAGYWRHAI